jgi:hypothetical protein
MSRGIGVVRWGDVGDVRRISVLRTEHLVWIGFDGNYDGDDEFKLYLFV